MYWSTETRASMAGDSPAALDCEPLGEVGVVEDLAEGVADPGGPGALRARHPHHLGGLRRYLGPWPRAHRHLCGDPHTSGRRRMPAAAPACQPWGHNYTRVTTMRIRRRSHHPAEFANACRRAREQGVWVPRERSGTIVVT